MKWGPRVEKLLQSIREWDASRAALQDLPGYAEAHDRLEPEWFALGRLLVQEQQARQVRIDYTNWRGVRTVRRIEPRGIWFGTSRFHVGEQWFLSALDVEKQEVRDFALTSLHAWGATEEALMGVKDGGK
jgi:predicted DNA-binding transcriptional regulator YafY